MSKATISQIEQELEAFAPEDRARLGDDFVSYLRRLREIRRELDLAERDVAAGRVVSLADLDSAIRELRRQYAGV